MSSMAALKRRLEDEYQRLPPQLRKAARHIAKAPTEVALYSLRQIAIRAEVGPTTLVRLAAQLGFSSHNAFRETCREGLRSGADRYAVKAQRLQSFHTRTGFETLHRDTAALIEKNIAETYASVGAADIAAAARIMKKARRIYILGLRCNYSLSFYLYYLLRTFMADVVLLEGRMGMLIDELGEIGAKDALLAFSYEPYAIEAVKAVEHAAARGASIVAFTDSSLSPIAHGAARRRQGQPRRRHGPQRPGAAGQLAGAGAARRGDGADQHRLYAARDAIRPRGRRRRPARHPQGLPGDARVIVIADTADGFTLIERLIARDYYYGGMVAGRSAKLHPALYDKGLLEAARRRGIAVCGRAPVKRTSRPGPRWRLETGRGTVEADEVVMAANGYTGEVTPRLKRRLVPIASHIIATEELCPDLAASLIPKGRTISDTRRALCYYRMSPDGKRVLFGGCARFTPAPPETSAPALHRFMLERFPQLRGARVIHGCNGSGVAMMTYLGWQTARKIVGAANYRCAFDAPSFPDHALYNGNPWFLPFLGGHYRLRDALDRRFA